MRKMYDSWLREPRADDPPRRVWRDWVLVGAVLIGASLEAVFRNDISAPFAAVPFVMLIAPVLLWRRVHPLRTFLVAFGGVAVYDVIVVLLLGYEPLNIYSSAVLLVVLYSLYRWGSGREMVMGTPPVVAMNIIANTFDYNGVGDIIGGFVVLALCIAIALVVRYRKRFQEQEREQVRVQERERLARELHDTVAHHMSAIAIQAQAGRFVAQNGSLDGATQALEVIEEEASRTLSEMRTIVGALREQNAPVAMTPQHGMADIQALASAAISPTVTIDLPEGLHSVSGAVGAAAYRIVQESITNARRHARNASEVKVHVRGDDALVHVTISDDGERSNASATPGFGVIGMTERAALLGGTLDAGPSARGGWVVRAALPRDNGV